MRLHHWLAATMLISSAGSASAQSADTGAAKGTIITLVRGSCSTLVLAGKDMTSQCGKSLINAAYPTGSSSFMFTVAGGAMVSFFGRDKPAIHDHAMIYLQRVTFKDDTYSNPSSEVSGVCTYSNPFAGPARVDCEAESNDGEFKAVFTTDGQQPDVQQL